MPPTVYDGGIRCIKVSPDGMHLASGDRQGNIRIYDLPSLECQNYKEAHDGEILSLDYSTPKSKGLNEYKNVVKIIECR